MESYRRAVLGPDALAYLVEGLRRGKTLAKETASRPEHFQRVYTVLPPAASNEKLDDFLSGGKVFPIGGRHQPATVVPIQDMDGALCEIIQSWVESGPRRAVVIENPLAEPGDADLDGVTHLLTHSREVYHLVAQPFSSTGDVRSAIRDAKSMLEVRGVMTTLPVTIDPAQSPAELSLSDLQQLAQLASAAFIGVYDGESFLIAER